MSSSDREGRPEVPARIASLAERAVRRGQQGLVVGTLEGSGRSVHGFGRVRDASPEAPDGDTLFEIGSITKVFTALLLADMALEGLVRLDDTLADYLPPGTEPPRADPPITLAELASHSAGLPRDVKGTRRAMLRRPLHPYEALLESFAKLTVDDLNVSLASTKVKRKPGKARYSNVGAGLLGNALARRAGKTYGELVHERIYAPLGLASTYVDVPEELRAQLAQGHTRRGRPRPAFRDPALEGAGALRSTANDLLRFLAAQLEPPDGRLGEAIALTQVERARLSRRIGVGLGWIAAPLRRRPHRILWHNGGTGGFRSFVGLVRETETAVAVLGNTNRSVDLVGIQVLEALNPNA
jgi:D-alanyl-D-alanine-carboxypeptidase/D-alanyl-D-alanine-endopeptidase